MTNSNLYPWLISELVEKNEWEQKKYISASGLVPVVKQLTIDEDTPIIGMEIGVASGWNINHFLSNIPNLHLIGVDPYLPYQDWNSYIGEDILDAHYKIILMNL
jgi:hypothetical protein